MATVRIYKVAELLGAASQEVLALLKRDHGIELKSASSTIEEVVARSFVERVARQRNIALPGGDLFAEHAPVPAKGGKKTAPAKKAEPPKPAAPVLGPPRLVKTIRPVAPPPPAEVAEPEPEELAEQPLEEPPALLAAVEPVPEPEPEPEPAPVVQQAAGAAARVEELPAETPAAAGRVEPPTQRVRIEEP
ncbi:MAG: translation initiation factor IF-2 N-terminal domain-containing protein, partial [Acidobacteria bacterium]|nr:translation initiation factor IF-2 N-terminal domain-containing protein [Acidobacteriota bacterium]